MTKLKIEAGAYYSPHHPEMRAIGTVGSLAQQRHNGTGLPYSKIGSKVYYSGDKILEALEAGASK